MNSTALGEPGDATAGVRCDSLCQAKSSTLHVHQCVIAHGARVLVLTNPVPVGFLIGFWGLRLWNRHTFTMRRTRTIVA